MLERILRALYESRWYIAWFAMQPFNHPTVLGIVACLLIPERRGDPWAWFKWVGLCLAVDVWLTRMRLRDTGWAIVWPWWPDRQGNTLSDIGKDEREEEQHERDESSQH
jgi:hypothetical protein